MSFENIDFFYGDRRATENPLTFLRAIESELASLPHLSESSKCNYLYLHCSSTSDAEVWYEKLECDLPAAVASWAIFVKHFRVKWLGAPPSSLLDPEPVISIKSVTATLIACETPTITTVTDANTIITTATIPAHIDTAAPAILETITTSKPLNQAADVQHVTIGPTPVPARTEVKLTTSTNTTDSSSAVTMVEQQDNEEPVVGKEKEQERSAEQQESGGEHEKSTEGRIYSEVRVHAPPLIAFNVTVHEPQRFDWAREGDDFLDLSPVAFSDNGTIVHVNGTPQVRGKATPFDPDPGDVADDPIGVALANTVPTELIPVNSISAAPILINIIDPDPGDVATGVALTNTVPIDPAPIGPVSCNMAIEPHYVALTNAMPSEPIRANPAATILVSPTDHVPVDPDLPRLGFFSTVLADPVPVDPTGIAPLTPVHIDPVSVTPANLKYSTITILIGCLLTALFGYKTHLLDYLFIRHFLSLKFHFLYHFFRVMDQFYSNSKASAGISNQFGLRIFCCLLISPFRDFYSCFGSLFLGVRSLDCERGRSHVWGGHLW